MRNKHTPICFVISSPSGAGKTTVVEEVLAKDSSLKKTISHTTRKKRPGEQNGVDYHFTTREKFLKLKNEKKLLEWATVYGNFYGTSKREIERILNRGSDAILVIENKGAKAIRKLFPNSVFILVIPPSFRELQKRILKRRHSGDNIQTRLESAKKEIRDLLWYDYVIVNKNLKKSVQTLQAILQAERCKISPMVKRSILHGF